MLEIQLIVLEKNMKVFNKKFSQIKINQNEKFNTYITEEKLKQFVSISGDKKSTSFK